MSNGNKKDRFDSHYDVVVIGTGMGGLSAGVHAAKFGKKVLVLEQHNLGDRGRFFVSFF